MINTKIEWTESTWNPVTGCTKISLGCKNCYAERMAKRLKSMGQTNYKNGFDLAVHEHVFEYPLKWKKPRVIFVNSMSDLFHEEIPLEVIQKIFDVMNRAHWHTFQILTKRAERLAEIADKLNWSDNIWIGVTVESSKYKNRIDYLRSTQAKMKFLSIEPLIEPVGELNLENIDWVIVGGESGPESRPIEIDWVREVRDQCVTSTQQAGNNKCKRVCFFFKQWGGVNTKKNGKILDGRIWDEIPTPINNIEQLSLF